MMERLGLFMERHQTTIFRCLFGLWAAWLLFCFLWTSLGIGNGFNYNSWGFSDWMINYEGGFVRRGIVGEILWKIYQWHPYPLQPLVLTIMSISFLILLFLLVRLFKKEGWSYMFLLAPFFVVSLMGLYPYTMRRDFITLLLTWGIFHLYHHYTKNKKVGSLITMHTLSIFTLLMHEASFFFTFPILFYHYCFTSNMGKGMIFAWLKLLKGCLFFSPALTTMFFVCIHKGNLDIAQAIWDSWKPCIETFPIGDSGQTIGHGVSALNWTTKFAVHKHLTMNFTGDFYGPIPSFPFTILNFICIYYLTTHINTIDLRWNRLNPVNNTAMSNFLLLQFVFMLPLFTILSCDWVRILSYWVCSSLLAYHYWKDDNDRLFPYLNPLSNKLQKFRLLCNPYIYFIIIFSLPIPFAGGPTLYTSNVIHILSVLHYQLCKLF